MKNGLKNFYDWGQLIDDNSKLARDIGAMNLEEGSYFKRVGDVNYLIIVGEAEVSVCVPLSDAHYQVVIYHSHGSYYASEYDTAGELFRYIAEVRAFI